MMRHLNPWKARREEAQRRIAELRSRDGDHCRRCRRPLRFDLPSGHDSAPKIEPIRSGGAADALDNFCLCHGRCNAEAADKTLEVIERVRTRRVDEAKPKKRRRAA